MNNTAVEALLDDSDQNLLDALAIVNSLGGAAKVVPYLNQYSIIRACGTIEIAFKQIISDFCSHRSMPQINNFINAKVKDSSMNPSYDNIYKLLKTFDETWCKEFKDQINLHPDKSQILFALKSLVDSRNDFAHGGNPTTSITDAIDYYTHAKKLIIVLDSVVK